MKKSSLTIAASRFVAAPRPCADFRVGARNLRVYELFRVSAWADESMGREEASP